MKDKYSVAERNRIVEENIGCVDKLLHRYRRLWEQVHLEVDDLYQDLALRLVLAVDAYRTDKGPFHPYLRDQLLEELLRNKEIRKLHRGGGGFCLGKPSVYEEMEGSVL